MNMLEGKVALVTGASRGIGKGCALALAKGGAHIAVNYRVDEKAAEETCALGKAVGVRAVAFQADVSKSLEVNRMVQRIEHELGTVQILVNNAGIARLYPWDQIPEEGWDEMLAVNLKSAFLVTQAVLPRMRASGWGRIVNMSSNGAATGGVMGPFYAASKAGLIGLTHSYASLLVKEGITVNAVAPSYTETDMAIKDLKADLRSGPMGRPATVEEVVDVVVMLAKNGYITGQTIFVNAGRHKT